MIAFNLQAGTQFVSQFLFAYSGRKLENRFFFPEELASCFTRWKPIVEM